MEEVPFEDRHVPRAAIEWERSAWWWYPLTRSIHPAIKLSTLAVALFSMALAQAGISFAAWIFHPRDSAGSQLQAADAVFSSTIYPTLPFTSPILTWLQQALEFFRSMAVGTQEIAFVTFCLLWLTLIFSIFGGVLARRALVELGQRTVAPWGESIRIVTSRTHSYLWSTGMHLVALLLLAIPIALLGLLSRAGGPGAHIAGTLMLLAFPLVFAFGRLLLSMFLCFPLSVCAITAEKKADAFEGFSRSNAYLFQRPVVAAICAMVLGLVGLVGEQIVMWTLHGGWLFMRSVFAYFSGPLPETAIVYFRVGDGLVSGLIFAYWFSFFWSAAAALYLILRHSVDSTDLDEIDTLENPIESSLPEIPKQPPELGMADDAAANTSNRSQLS
ncbi:MAG: hypothetical protein NXI32_31005 [bacterium]|nr:hypothetical protein [bacterium]